MGYPRSRYADDRNRPRIWHVSPVYLRSSPSGRPLRRHHITIDPHQATRFANGGLQLVQEAGIAEMVEFHAEESQITLPRLRAANAGGYLECDCRTFCQLLTGWPDSI